MNTRRIAALVLAALAASGLAACTPESAPSGGSGNVTTTTGPLQTVPVDSLPVGPDPA